MPFKNVAAKTQLEFQTAGLIGLVHAFYGLNFDNKHTLSMGMGYVPKLTDHDEMNLFSVKYRYTPANKYIINVLDNKMEWRPYSFSITLLHGKDHDIYKTLSYDPPKDYYIPTDNRLIFSMQTNFIVRDNIEIYWDWSVLDIGLVSYARNFEFYRDNYSFMGLAGVVSYGVGFRVNL